MSVDDEVRALRTSAGWSRLDHVALVHVDGPSAFELLQSASSHNLYLREGRVRQTLFLRDDAGVFADVFIGLADDGFYVLGEGPSEAALVAWLEGVRDRNPAFARVVVRGLSAERVILGVDGPYAWEVLAGLFGRAVLGMPYLTLMRRGEVVCLRAGKTGEYGYLVLAPRPAALELEGRLVEIGGALGLVAVGRDALDVCALENWHFSIRTLRETTLAAPLTPLELQLQWRVAYDNEFVGAAALRARRADGAKVRLTSFTADGPIAPGDVVRLGVDAVGEVMGACLSPTLGTWIGSALLAKRIAHPHVTFSVGAAQLTTRTTPLLENLSLRVDPHQHAYATRDASASPRPAPQ